jgi:hypothetical protein
MEQAAHDDEIEGRLAMQALSKALEIAREDPDVRLALSTTSGAPDKICRRLDDGVGLVILKEGKERFHAAANFENAFVGILTN